MSDALTMQIAAGRRMFDGQAFKSLRDDAAAWKPTGYNSDTSKRRDFYRGEQASWVREDLAKRYPQTYSYIRPYMTPLVRHLVEQQATVNKPAPRRDIVDGDQIQLDTLYSEASVNAHLQYAEEVAVCAGIAFVRAAWDVYDQRVQLSVYWPDQIDVVCDPDRPDRLDLATAIIARMADAEGVTAKAGVKSEDRGRWEVWSQPAPGEWLRFEVSNGGKTWIGGDVVYQRSPFVALYAGRPPGLMFELQPGDDVEANLTVDALYSDLLWSISMSGTPQIYYTGRGASDSKTLQAGPRSIWTAQDGTFGVLQNTPAIAAVKEVARDIVSQLLVLRGISPSSASADPRYESGVALKVQQAPMLEHRAARIPFMREFEELRLWPLLRSVYEYGRRYDFGGASMRWLAGELQLPLDDEAEMRVNAQQVANGMLTWEDVMVKRGDARDLADARAKRAANLPDAPTTENTWTGIQITSAITVVEKVAGGLLPRDSGVEIIKRAFALDDEGAADLLSTAGLGFVPTAPAAPVPFGGAPAVAVDDEEAAG
jgi:hypothetical protein